MSENNAPMKMELLNLHVEITRQCNLNCEHCARGDAQDVTITTEIIDTLLDQISLIWKLDLTGGEPFLHPEMVEYLIDGVIKRDILVMSAGCVTNGTICSQRAADAFSRLFEHAKNRLNREKRKHPLFPGEIGDFGIWVSYDKFHKKQNNPLYFPEATYNFYKKHCLPGMSIKYANDFPARLGYVGRARNLPADPNYPFYVDSSFHRFAMGNYMCGFSCPNKEDYPIIEKVNKPSTVICGVEISSKGGFHMYGLKSFDEIDEQAQDNILTCSLYDCIWNWNHRYPLTCPETEEYYRPAKFILANKDTYPMLEEVRKNEPKVRDKINEKYANKCLVAMDDLIWVRQQLQNRYKDKFIPFLAIFHATRDTYKEALELPAHDLNTRWPLLRNASKALKEVLAVHHIDTSCPDLKYDDTDYDNTTDEDGLGDMAMMELLEKY